MKSSDTPFMKTVVCVLFSQFILLHSPNLLVAGTCGAANNKYYITAPEGRLPSATLCSSGTFNDRSDLTTAWRWRCDTQNCQANIVKCGTGNGATLTTAPTGTGLCEPSGINDTVVLAGNTWTWHCVDYEGAQASCSANQRINGACDTATTLDYVNPPASNLCSAGTAGAVTNDGSDHWRWSCSGVNGGNPASCTADIVNCGSANGTSTLNAPTSNLCSEGTASAVTPSGDQWTWTCTDGIGATASCSANNKDNGACGTAQGQTYNLAPTSGLCVSSSGGTPSSVTASGTRWIWDCLGTFGGNDASCWADHSINGTCGAAISTPSEYSPTTDLCSTGTASSVTDGTTTWNWTCAGANGGTSVNCSTTHITNGDCGAANGGSYETQPATGLCNAGVATAVTGNGQYWNWACTGVGGGSNANCTANITTTNTNSYCAQPPFIASPVAPNVMTVIDASGSMGWRAYNRASTEVPVPVYNTNEEGYFRPDKNYRYNSTNGYWEETISASVACPDNSHNPVTSSIYKGSCLNYHKMSRMDLVRWAVTGGTPDSCTGNSRFNANQCDPEAWEQPGNTGKVGGACNNTIGGCILLATDGTKVKVPWSRVWDGLAFQFKVMNPKPRMGALFFSDSTVRSDGQVYMGDFTAPNSTSDNFPFMNLITAINSTAPDGGTPTGPAMWDTFNYFKQVDPQYGGIPAQQGSGDRWKNPMYVCDGGGANCHEIPCAKNFVLLLSDGQWNTPSCSIDDGNSDPVKPAYQMHQPFTNTGTNKTTNVTATYAIGMFLGGTGEQSLKNVAMYGSFNKSSGWPDSLTDYPLGTCNMDDCGDGKGSACTALPTSTSDWDNDTHIGVPDTFHSSANATEIKESIKNAILDMLRRSSSGTAVSVLSSSEGSGANLMQALFYPLRAFDSNTEVSWTSDLMNYWYYLDPYFSAMQIREDTVRDGSDYTLLNLHSDYITTFAFDSSLNKTMAQRWQDLTGTGNVTLSTTSTTSATYKGAVAIEKTNAIWRAGFNLWWTLPGNRTLLTPKADMSTLIPFDTTSSSTLAPYLGQSAVPDGMQTINYVLGYDCANPTTGVSCDCATVNTDPTCAQIGRNRTVKTGACSTRKSPCDGDTDCPTGETCISDTQVWKMGDIISSTPRIMGPGPLNNYHIPAPSGYNDATYAKFIKSNDYANRQTVFVGSNDGMLHAFRLGKMLQKWTTPSGRTYDQIVKQEGGTTGTSGIGTERFGFIPQNVLPYLQYLRDPNYCHLYLVDGPTTLTDVSINKPSACTQGNYADCVKKTTMQTQKVCSVTTSTTCSIDANCPSGENCVDPNTINFNETSWRTVLVGSMGLGGGTCQITPPLAAPYASVGQSSYFALDVTAQDNPKLLWEFADPDLGTTNVGAGIVKVGNVGKRCSNNDNQTCSTASDCGTNPTLQCVTTATNGKWYAILASGPTGTISDKSFLGKSTQTLKIFVLDLATGTKVRTIDTGITKAFAGSISNSVVDLDKANAGSSGNYQDDALYIGYVQDTSTTTVTSSGGGVLRLVINNNIDPDQWSVSKVIDGIGPVTSSVANLLDRANGKLWLYFGEGRYFFKTDDSIDSRHLYGIPEPCFQNSTILTSCTTTVAFSSLQNQTTISGVSATASTNAINASQNGWYVTLPTGTSQGPERVISNPTPDPNGAVFFLSFAPTSDICSFGGTTYLWALDYKTAGTVGYLMQGKALVQVSTGEIKELNLADAFTAESHRKTTGFMGIPPAGQGIMIITNPAPLKKFMHVQEQ